MKPLIFWGATGHARVLREALQASGLALVAIFDNRDIASPFSDVPIFHGIGGLDEWTANYKGVRPVGACIAIGGNRGTERLELLRWLEARGHPPQSVIHARAFVADTSEQGRGCQVLALAAVCAGARLGDGVIVNTSASIDHDCIIGDGVHVAPGARIAGEVTVGDRAFIGTGAVVLPRLHVGARATVGAGAVVTRDVPDDATVIGNPARQRTSQSRKNHTDESRG